MAMLQLGGHLTNATVKITPRVFWSITAQQLLSISSTTAKTWPTVTSLVKEMKEEQKSNGMPSHRVQPNTTKGKIINEVFKNLTLSGEDESSPSNSNQEIEEKIRNARDRDELLNLVQHVDFDHRCAAAVLNKLYIWIAEGKIKMKELEQDPRFLAVNKIVASPKGSETRRMVSNFQSTGHQILRKMRDKGSYKPSSSAGVSQSSKESINATISVLTSLASAQKRSFSMLQDLSSKIVASKQQLDLKQVGDILYSVALLNFYDQPLMEKMSKALLRLIPQNDRCAVIGSILTSVSFLRYKNETLLDHLSTWIVEHKETVRPQEISSLLMTLATMGYTSENFEDFYQSIILPLKESDMCQSSEWLDVVWALTVLNKATPQHFESVLNSDFLNRLTDLQLLSTSKSLKLLNINAASRLLVSDYKGPLIQEDSQLWDTPLMRTKEKTEISNAVVSALKMLLPSDSTFLDITPNTKLGFSLDAVLCVDKSCTPLPVDSKSTNDKEVFRIAVLGCCYAEFCRGKEELIGPVKLHRNLLEKHGYKVLLVPYTEINAKDKLVTRVKYLIDGIKALVQSNEMQVKGSQK